MALSITFELVELTKKIEQKTGRGDEFKKEVESSWKKYDSNKSDVPLTAYYTTMQSITNKYLGENKMKSTTKLKLENIIRRLINEETLCGKINEDMNADAFVDAVDSGNIKAAFDLILKRFDDDTIEEFEDELASGWGAEYKEIASDIYASDYEGTVGSRSKINAIRSIRMLNKKNK